MKKIFLDDLIRYTDGNNRGTINWNKSIGIKVKFIYSSDKVVTANKFEGYLEIMEYNLKGQKLVIKYKNDLVEIRTGDLCNCKISNILRKEIYTYPFNENDNRYINLSNVILCGKGINWDKTAKSKIEIPFKYYNIKGIIKIISYENRQLIIGYKEYSVLITTGNFLKCRLGGLLKEDMHRPIFCESDNRRLDLREVPLNGDGIDWIETARFKTRIKFKYDDIFGEIEVIKYIKKGKMLKLKYNNIIFNMAISSFKQCNLGSILNKNNRSTIIGINDIATTNPIYTKYFVNKDDTYKYTRGTSKKIKLKCPDCGYEKEMLITNLIRAGFGCPICGDGISYPNKFMLNLLQQLKINFKAEKIFEWSENKRYDFYINGLNCIIEMNGEQHYTKSFHTIKTARTLEEEQENDKFKEELAYRNNIKNYITIDARKSEVKFIKDNIIGSNLMKLIDLSKVNWLECGKFASSNLVKDVCDLKNKNPEYSTVDISKIVHCSHATIIKYLKKGTVLGWCNYNTKKESKRLGKKYSGANSPSHRKVVCITTNQIFDTITEAKFKLKASKITECCKGNRQHSGRLEDGTRLQWKYYEDYIKLLNKAI